MNQARQLGLWSAVALVVANMVGTGVFTTSGFLLGDLASRWLVLAAWLCGGVIALLGAVCYGALARRIPESGGEYIFLTRTLHPAAGYIAGWVSLLVGFSAPLAAAAIAFGEYAQLWFGGISPRALGAALVLVFVLVHSWQVRGGALVQNLSVAFKGAALFIFIAFAGAKLRPEGAEVAAPFQLGPFAVSLVWISFSYSGWNAAIYVSSEIRDAERNVPRAMVIGTLCVALLYVLLNAVFVFAAPIQELAGQLQVGTIAARHLGGPTLAHSVTAIICLALVTSVSSLIMTGPRVYAKMAEDGYLPRIFNPRGGIPRNAILLQGALALLLIWTAAYESLLTYIGFTLGLGTAAAVIGLIRLRFRERLPVPGWPVVPVLFLVFVLGTAGFAIARRPMESLLGLATLLLGWVIWLFAYRSKSRSSPHRQIRGR